MRFFSAGVLASFAAAVGSASAAVIVNMNKRCDLSECIIGLAAEGVSCAAALAEGGLDPVADIACILDAGAASLAVYCDCRRSLGSSFNKAGSINVPYPSED
ncbi:hypothetical protein C8J57DRAFT_1235486 [Mycena rebaudengoi]|nr:hypothetical protein C8J57DRAFT_1235486 [Mycena rebaudengoi]